ncbi:MAG: hypothetical protein IPJ62_18075 [Betaproteobacteria bacterium]|nr:hypothetical protein [Betaproteobacteria bacterium]
MSAGILARARLKERATPGGAGSVRVPAILVGDRMIVGYSPDAGTDRLILEALASRAAAVPAAAEGGAACAAEASLSCDAGPGAATPPSFEVNVFGRGIALDDVGLPLFTLIMGWRCSPRAS